MNFFQKQSENVQRELDEKFGVGYLNLARVFPEMAQSNTDYLYNKPADDQKCLHVLRNAQTNLAYYGNMFGPKTVV